MTPQKGSSLPGFQSKGKCPLCEQVIGSTKEKIVRERWDELRDEFKRQFQNALGGAKGDPFMETKSGIVVPR